MFLLLGQVPAPVKTQVAQRVSKEDKLKAAQPSSSILADKVVEFLTDPIAFVMAIFRNLFSSNEVKPLTGRITLPASVTVEIAKTDAIATGPDTAPIDISSASNIEETTSSSPSSNSPTAAQTIVVLKKTFDEKKAQEIILDAFSSSESHTFQNEIRIIEKEIFAKLPEWKKEIAYNYLSSRMSPGQVKQASETALTNLIKAEASKMAHQTRLTFLKSLYSENFIKEALISDRSTLSHRVGTEVNLFSYDKISSGKTLLTSQSLEKIKQVCIKLTNEKKKNTEELVKKFLTNMKEKYEATDFNEAMKKDFALETYEGRSQFEKFCKEKNDFISNWQKTQAEFLETFDSRILQDVFFDENSNRILPNLYEVKEKYLTKIKEVITGLQAEKAEKLKGLKKDTQKFKNANFAEDLRILTVSFLLVNSIFNNEVATKIVQQTLERQGFIITKEDVDFSNMKTLLKTNNRINSSRSTDQQECILLELNKVIEDALFDPFFDMIAIR